MLRNSLCERNSACQLVRKRVSQKGAVENSQNVHAFVISDDWLDYDHFVLVEVYQGEGLGMA